MADGKKKTKPDDYIIETGRGDDNADWLKRIAGGKYAEQDRKAGLEAKKRLLSEAKKRASKRA